MKGDIVFSADFLGGDSIWVQQIGENFILICHRAHKPPTKKLLGQDKGEALLAWQTAGCGYVTRKSVRFKSEDVPLPIGESN